MLSSRKSWSCTILFYCHFANYWRQRQKVGVLLYFSFETLQNIGDRDKKLEYNTQNLELTRTLVKAYKI